MNKVIKNNSWLILFCLLLFPSLSHGQGSRYTGTYKKSAPIEYSNKKNIVIEGLEFSSANGRALTLWSCDNVIIKNCKFKDVNMTVAIYAENSTNIVVTDCTFENVQTGFIAQNCRGGIKFEYNDTKNILGNIYGGSVFAQMVQFLRSSGPNNSISYNVCENIPRESASEDIINMFASNGTPDSPIRIEGNWLRGGGPSGSSGGILLGDHGGSYQIAENNILVDPGQYGMAIGGGNNMTIKNNKIYGKRQSFTNVGLYAVNWTADVSPSHNITIENNEINFTNASGSLNNTWFHESVGTIKGRETNKYNSNLNESILPSVILNQAQNPGDNTPPITPPEDTAPVTPPKETPPDSPPEDTTPDSPPEDTTPDSPPEDTTPDSPPEDTTPDSPPEDTTPDSPPEDTTPDSPPEDTTPDSPPEDTTPDSPPEDTTPDSPPEDTTPDSPPEDTTPDSPPEDTTPDSPPEDTTPDSPPEDTTPDSPPEDTTPDSPPEDTTPDSPPEDNTPDAKMAQVYIDSFNRIAIKYFHSPASRVYSELFTSTEHLGTIELIRFNTVFNLKLTKGNYYVRITYSDLGKTETIKVTFN